MKLFPLLIISMLFVCTEQWETIRIDPTLDNLAVDSTDWAYPWYVIKHTDHFEHTFGEPISKEDTIHQIKNALCYVRQIRDSTDHVHRLPWAKAEWKKDTLCISIFQENASDNQKLTLKIHEGQFIADYKIASITPLDDWQVEILEHSLVLHEMPQPGKIIKGRLRVQLQERIDWSEGTDGHVDWVRKSIEGTFVIE